MISEAGCPAVADPGADVVAIAQRKGYKVVPLVGPSSILMSVMGSGFNGQSFAFHGYLPIDASQRTNAIKKLEGRIYSLTGRVWIYSSSQVIFEAIHNLVEGRHVRINSSANLLLR